jgi:hypothetical protein
VRAALDDMDSSRNRVIRLDGGVPEAPRKNLVQ